MASRALIRFTQCKPSKRGQFGFNLVELMITCGIVTTLAAASVPAFTLQHKRSVRFEIQKALGEWALTLALFEGQSNHARAAPVRAGYTFQFFSQQPGTEATFWVVAQPSSQGRFAGEGALSLTREGLGCWHRQNDAPSSPQCLPGDEVW